MALTKEQFDLLKEKLQQARVSLPPDQYQKITSAISQSVEKEGFLKSLYKGIASPVLNLIARPGQLAYELQGKEAPYGKFAGVDIAPAPKTTADIKKDVGRGVQTAALAIPAGTIPKVALMGGAFGLGSSLEEGNPLFSKETAIQTLLGAGTGALIAGGTKLTGKAISKGVEKIKEPIAKGLSESLGYTSDVSPGAIKRAITNPQEFSAAQKEVVNLGNAKVLSNLQQGVRSLRTTLTDYYKTGQQQIIDATPTLKVGLNDNEARLFEKIADRFGVDLPQNIKSFGSKELLDLNAEINSLYSKKAIREGVEGVIVRKGKDVLENLVNKNFSEYGMNEFLQGYGAQKTILDGMNEIFNAYKTKSPKAVAQAFRNIKAAFERDKYAYLEVLEAFERQTGVKILDQLRAMQLQPFINKSGKFSMDEVFRAVLLPLTSPKLVGIEAKAIGRLLNAAQSTGEFIANLSGLLEKGQRAKIPLNKIGLTIEDVSKKGSGAIRTTTGLPQRLKTKLAVNVGGQRIQTELTPEQVKFFYNEVKNLKQTPGKEILHLDSGTQALKNSKLVSKEEFLKLYPGAQKSFDGFYKSIEPQAIKEFQSWTQKAPGEKANSFSSEVLQWAEQYKPKKDIVLYKGIEKGESISFSRPSSWTYNKEIAKEHTYGNGQVVSRKFSPSEVLLDSTELPSELQKKMKFYEEEAEVIIKKK